MNPEPTKELKEKYFAAHWGQEVAVQNEGGGSGFVYRITGETIADIGRDYLILRDISYLTDAEAIEVAKTGGVSYALESSMATQGRLLLNEYLHSSRCNVRGADWMQICDYLRSIGIALPFMGHSVNQLIDYGWLKLREGGVNNGENGDNGE